MMTASLRATATHAFLAPIFLAEYKQTKLSAHQSACRGPDMGHFFRSYHDSICPVDDLISGHDKLIAGHMKLRRAKLIR
jgi:hypothetical protein